MGPDLLQIRSFSAALPPAARVCATRTHRWRALVSKRRSLSQRTSVFSRKDSAKRVDRSGLEPPHHPSGTGGSNPSSSSRESCELAISRRIADCISRSRTDTLPVHIAVRCPCSCSGGEASSDIRGLSARLNINTPLPLRNLRETALHQRLSGSDDLKPIVPAVQRFEPASKCCSISSLTRSGASASGR